MECEYTKYEPIFGSWYITKQLGQGSEGKLFEIQKKDALGHVSFSAMKAITIPGDEEARKAILSRCIRQEDLEAYYQEAVSANVREYRLMYQLKGNSHIVSYEDHQVIRHDDDAGWDILIRIEKLTPLIDHILESPLTVREVARLGLDICKGLVYCQQNGIVHRDIKPDNIFLSNSGDYKLGDFGIAQILEYTHTIHSRKGTYTFMAPEVFRGEGYGSNVDIYSLGLVMYKYLNDSRSPFLPQYPELFTTDDEDDALAKRISGKEIPPPAHGSRRLKQIILKACRFHAEDRYQSAQEMLDDLEALIHDKDWGKEPDEHLHTSSESGLLSDIKHRHNKLETGRLSAGQRRRRRRIASVCLALILCGAAACFVVWKTIPRHVTDIEGISADTKIYIGDELTPEYSVEPKRFSDEKITFTSSDDSIFTVDKNGHMRALSVGDAVLTMKAKDYTESVQITVIPKVTSIDNVDDTIKLKVGKSTTLKPALSPEKFSSESISYNMSDTDIATVSADGTVKAIAAGKTTLTISSGGCTKRIVVKVEKPVQPKQQQKTTVTTPSSNTKTPSKPSGSNGYFDSGDDEYFY